jgi:hypothetical protein
MKRRLYSWTAAGLLTVLMATALVLVPGASAGSKAGTLDCALNQFNSNKYALQVGTTITCTIDGASDASGKTTVPVIIKSSDLGNTTVTGTVSGSGSSTKVTFEFTAPLGGCNTVVVAYISNGNNTTLAGGNAGGFAYVNSSGKLLTTCNAAPATPKIFLGYADNYFTHGSPTGLPWLNANLPAGLPSPQIIGCGVNPNGGALAPDVCPTDPIQPTVDSYDAGAILIDNPGTTAITVTNASVNIGTCGAPGSGAALYDPWPGLNISIPAGGTLVLTQTGLSDDPCGQEIGDGYNFDTSESSGNDNCTPNGAIPVVSLTIGGQPVTVTDSGQILNTGGIDPGGCFVSGTPQANEFHAFTQVSP